jgi:hypothetical protein
MASFRTLPEFFESANYYSGVMKEEFLRGSMSVPALRFAARVERYSRRDAG